MTSIADRSGAGTVAGSGVGDRRPIGLLDEHQDSTDRRYVAIGPLATESGERLESVTMAYQTWGRLSPQRDNAVLVLHALTGDSHVVGPIGPDQPTPGWWDGLIGPGHVRVLSPCLKGYWRCQSPDYIALPSFTVR